MGTSCLRPWKKQTETQGFMRLSIQKEEGNWRLSDMEEIHVQLLRQAADDASMTDCPEGRLRMVPKPVAPQDELREGEFLEDWNEYVAEDLENQFAGDVGTLLADLDSLESYTLEEDPDEELYSVAVPIANGMAWFSTLNQARIMLDQHFILHPHGQEFEPHPDEELIPGVDVSERFTAYMRYEFYAVLQEWLVKEVLE